MSERFRTILKEFLAASLAVFLILLFTVYIAVGSYFFAFVAGYLLSFLFVGSNFVVVMRNFRSLPNSEFYKRFFISLGVRFVLVIVVFLAVLKAIKIHQIYFTVSFIISYIFHSIIEIISINKILKTDN